MLIFRAPVLLPAARLFPLVPALATAGRRPSLLTAFWGLVASVSTLSVRSVLITS